MVLNQSLLKNVLNIVVCLLMGSLTVLANAQDRAALLKGVGEIVAPGGIPGDFAVYGDHVSVVLTGRTGKARLPMLVAARYGRGRAVAIGHEGFFGKSGMQNPDNVRLVINIAQWAGQKPLTELRVCLVEQDLALRDALTAAGCRVTVSRPDALNETLSARDVIWLNQSSLDGAGNQALIESTRQWVQRGGGLVLSGPAWGWVMTHEGRDLTRDHSGSQLLAPMGGVFSTAMLDNTGPHGFVTASDSSDSLELTQAALALKALEAQAAGQRMLTPLELGQVTTTLGQAVSALPENQLGLIDRVEALCAQKGGDLVPTRQTPITTAMPFARLKAILEARQYHRLEQRNPEKIAANPAAASFPGVVPANAPRITKTVTIDTRVPEWHGTGLYAAPGEIITVTVPNATVGKGFAILIGSHIDTLWHLDKWERFPEITLSRNLDAATVRVANPFGGTLFVAVPPRCRLGDVAVTIANAVPAPRFVRGITSRDEWKQSLRNAPGPWAEMEGKLVILSVPSYAVRDLDDPEALMAYWDEVMERCYTLYAAPKRNRPERYCVDRQISAGYMHSGYPIMTGDDVAKTFCDVNTLRGRTGIKCWGFYHEMGHNFQQPEWTWAAFGEVTNNLFSLYGTEMLNGVKVGAHPAMTQLEIDKRLKEVTGSPGKEKYYERDPWYPLTMFWLLRQEFGWEPFTKVFAEFRALPAGERPKTELAKHDQFLIRFSQATGHNLSGYLAAWGVETSAEARQLTSALPAWMPSTPTAPKPSGEKSEPPKPTSHTTRVIEGWNVRIDDRLLRAPNDVLGTRVLRFLEGKLTDIKAVVPADRLLKLQTVTIVVDLTHGKLRSIQYHPGVEWLKENGYDPTLVKCVHIPVAADLPTIRNIREQPWVVLHELAHSYHDQVLTFEDPRILAAFENYKKSGHGDATLLFDGRRVRHYALTDHKEFFAEMTEAYFGVNDFFPFNRAELITAEPEIYALLRTIWDTPTH